MKIPAICIATLAVLPSLAQDTAVAIRFGEARLEPPVMGYFVRGGAGRVPTLWAVMGVPESNFLEGPLPIPAGAGNLWVDPAFRYVAVQREDRVDLLSLEWRNRFAPLGSIEGVADQLVLSPKGGVAAVVSGGRTTIFSGLPEAPAAKWSADRAGQLLGVADDASHAAARTASGISVLRASGTVPIYAADDLSGAAYGRQGILVARTGSRSVALLDPATGVVRFSAPLAAQPGAVAFAAGGSAVVAGARGGATTINLDTGEHHSLAVGLVERWTPLRGRAFLTGDANGAAVGLVRLDPASAGSQLGAGVR